MRHLLQQLFEQFFCIGFMVLQVEVDDVGAASPVVERLALNSVDNIKWVKTEIRR